MQLRYPVAKAGQVISNISDTDHFEAQGLFQYLGIKILFGIMSKSTYKRRYINIEIRCIMQRTHSGTHYFL